MIKVSFEVTNKASCCCSDVFVLLLIVSLVSYSNCILVSYCLTTSKNGKGEMKDDANVTNVSFLFVCNQSTGTCMMYVHRSKFLGVGFLRTEHV